MSLNRAAKENLVRALAVSVIEHADELTSLDQAIGDGDHGLNMKRGFEAVLATLPGLADKSLPEMLRTIGTTLVMKVGGASRSNHRAPISLGQPVRQSNPSRRAGGRKPDRRPCSMSLCRCRRYLRRELMPKRSPQKLPRRPCAPRPCSRNAAGRPFSANVLSVIWILVRARPPSLSAQPLQH